MVTNDFKLEGSNAYLMKLGKNLSWDFEVILFFCKNAILNTCWYLKRFYSFKKINNIVLKFHFSSVRMPKTIEIR